MICIFQSPLHSLALAQTSGSDSTELLLLLTGAAHAEQHHNSLVMYAQDTP